MIKLGLKVNTVPQSLLIHNDDIKINKHAWGMGKLRISMNRRLESVLQRLRFGPLHPLVRTVRDSGSRISVHFADTE